MEYFIKYSLICVAMITLLLVPGSIIYHGTSLCLFRHFTGIQCPLCGMTRASCDLLHFRLASALHYNPVSLFLPFLLIVEVIYDVYHTLILIKIRKVIYLIFFSSLGILFIYRIMQFFL
jgi:hypothetical protein